MVIGTHKRTRIRKMIGRLTTGLLLSMMSTVSAQTIKLATIAPEGSAWMDSMRSGAAEIGERTDGRVKFKFYGGGVMGNDKQVLRKMRIGQLHGGAFPSSALAEFQKDSVLYAMPLLFNDLKEVQFVRNLMDDKLREQLEQAGYVNFGIAGGGFAHLMSTRPVANLDNLKTVKVWIPDGDTIAYGAIRALGVSPVTMPLTDVLTGLQTELIDTIMSPPVATIVFQWNTSVSYITELPVAYIYAMMVVDKKYFSKILPDDQVIVREVMERVYRGFDEQGNTDNKKAYQALLDDGMRSVTPDLGQIPQWRNVVQESNHKLVKEGVVSESLLLELECYLAAYRTGAPIEGCQQ